MKVSVFQHDDHISAWIKSPNSIAGPIDFEKGSALFGSEDLVGGLYGVPFPKGTKVSESWIWEMWLGISMLPDLRDVEVYVIGPSRIINGKLSAEYSKDGDSVSSSFESGLFVYFVSGESVILKTERQPHLTFLFEEGSMHSPDFWQETSPENWRTQVVKTLDSLAKKRSANLQDMRSNMRWAEKEIRLLDSVLSKP